MNGRILAVAAYCALLAGCSTVALPPGLTDAEIKAQVEEGNRQWWESMFPGEPMPEIEPIEYVDAAHAQEVIADCMRGGHIDGLLIGEDDSWVYLGNDSAVQESIDRRYFQCNAQYPYDPAELNILSDAQLKWIYYYNRDRLVPCLQLDGYTIINRTSDYVDGSFDYWIPYYEMYPLPTADEWRRIDLRCPPSPIGPLYRPTSG